MIDVYLRIGLPRASLAISKETGIIAFKSAVQEGCSQGLIHSCLAGVARVTFIKRPKRNIVNKRVNLFHLGMFHGYFFPVGEDNLGSVLSLLSRKEARRGKSRSPRCSERHLHTTRKASPSLRSSFLGDKFLSLM